MADIGSATWLAVGYGLFLLVAAHGVDLMARRASANTTRWRSGAFVYQEDHDAWLCPQDQWLWAQSFDPENRVMRYRATPSVCNSCGDKKGCTSGDHGREVTRAVDPWPGSEAERFHRAIACAIVVLALLWPAATPLTGVTGTELVLLVATVAVIALGSVPLWSHLRRSPASFPEHITVERPDEAAAARAVAAAREARRRSGYRSDRRPVPLADPTFPARRPAVPAQGPAGHEPTPQERDRFATRWGAFDAVTAEDDVPGGWSRRSRS